MDENLYIQLREHIDRMPIALPVSGDGQEIDLLKKLFTPEEARIVLELSALPESINRIHRRTRHLGYTKEELENKLDDMYRRGLIMGGPLLDKKRKGRKLYSKAQLAIGFFEFQVNHLSRDVMESFERYGNSTFYREMNRNDGLSQMRTIPIAASIPSEKAVVPYEDARRIVENAPEPLSIMNCICRQGHALLDKPCTRTKLGESCMIFGNPALYFIGNGQGREITRQRALDYLDEFEKIGLILQPENTRNPNFMCACCGCCCGVLTGLKNFAKPAEFYNSSYFASVDRDACTGCKTCQTRCNMEAVIVEDKKSRVNLDRCIGCGLCVTTCKSGAMTLRRKESAIKPPKNTDQLYFKILAKRYGTGGLLRTVGKSLIGRKF